MAPRLTIAEWTALGLTLMGIGPNPENWALVPVAAGVGLGVYALRRSAGFRERVAEALDTLDDMGAPEFALASLERLAVPPIGQQLALPAPRQPVVEAHRELPTLQEGFGGLRGLWGEEELEPLIRSRSRQLDVQPGRPRSGGTTRRLSNPEGRVTRQLQALPAPDEDTDWLRQDALEVMSIKEMVQTVNNDPDTYPFVILFGPPRSGKTTLAQLIALARPGKLVILDPKQPQGWKGAKWGGLPYVSKDADGSYQPMIDALTMGYVLMEDRYRKQATATKEFEPVTFIIDEAQVVVNECPEIAVLYKAILSKGAEARVRLVLTSTTDRAGALGFKGTADNLEGFVPIRLGRFAQKVLPDVVSLGENPKHWAVVNLGDWQAFDTSRTPDYLKLIGQRPGKVWNRVQYNCQVPNWDLEDEQPEQAPPPPRSRAVPAMARKALAEAPDSLLAGLLGLGEVSNVSSRETGTETLEFPSAKEEGGNKFPGTSDDVSTVSVTDAESARLVLQTMSADERRKLGNSLKLLTTAGKRDAILQGFGLSSVGRGYSRGKQLLDAVLLLREKGLLAK